MMQGARRLAPFGDDVAVLDDQAARIAPLADRPDRVAEGFAAESLVVAQHEIARRAALARNGTVDCFFQALRIEAGLCRRFALPGGLRKVAGG
jgi:hypothetical protein